MTYPAAWRVSRTEPPSEVTYAGVLRSSLPTRAMLGILLALVGYMLVVPLMGRTLVWIGWLLRGRPEQSAYIKAAAAYEVPEGLVAGHLALATLLVIAWLVYRYVHGMSGKWLASVQPGMRWRYLIACLLVALVALNGVMWLSMLGSDLPFTSAQENWVWFLIAIVLFSPLQAAAEEVFFRGYLFQALGSLSANRWLPIIASAALFAFFHGVQNPALFVDRFAFGLLAGLLVVLTGGLEAGIAAHVVNNLFAFGYAMFTGGVAHAKAIQHIGWVDAAWDVAGFALFALVAWWVAKRMRVATTTP